MRRRSSDNILTYKGLETLDEVKECIQEAEKLIDIRKVNINVRTDKEGSKYYNVTVKSVIDIKDDDDDSPKRKTRSFRK